MRAGVLTVSTSRSSGATEDEGGPALAELARGLGASVAAAETAPDERERIAETIRRWCDDEDLELVLTTGGTGLAPSDVTPEATRGLIEREAPGIAEAIRLASRPHSEHWMLSRGVAGVRGRTLIVNFPGNPAAIAQIGEAVSPALGHALELLAGRRPH